MKDIKDIIKITESQTKLSDIENYGRTWIGEWGADYCGNILTSFIKGIKAGMEKYKSDDPKFQERCMKFIEQTLENINKEIY